MARRNIDDCVNPMRGDDSPHQKGIKKISNVETVVGRSMMRRRAQVIEYDHVATFNKEPTDHMAANVARAAGNEDSSGHDRPPVPTGS